MATVANAAPRPMLVRIYRPDGSVLECTMTPSLARLLERMDRADERRERRHAKRCKTFSDLRLDGNAVAESCRSAARTDGYPWEGPQYRFDRLIGESRIWAGPRIEDILPLAVERLQGDAQDEWARVARPGGKGVPCEFCHGVWLAPTECCLRCSRTGADRWIESPTAADLKRRREPRPRADDGLSGGTGGKRPKKASKAKR